jgi:hypothetical protein
VPLALHLVVLVLLSGRSALSTARKLRLLEKDLATTEQMLQERSSTPQGAGGVQHLKLLGLGTGHENEKVLS